MATPRRFAAEAPDGYIEAGVPTYLVPEDEVAALADEIASRILGPNQILTLAAEIAAHMQAPHEVSLLASEIAMRLPAPADKPRRFSRLTASLRRIRKARRRSHV